MSEVAYVNGHDEYRGNILLDPDGTPTRAEIYNLFAEAGRPVQVEVVPEPNVTDVVSTAFLGIIAACLLADLVRGIREVRKGRNDESH